jgi:hypothetical protein
MHQRIANYMHLDTIQTNYSYYSTLSVLMGSDADEGIEAAIAY